jgi:hypothetical protein
MGTSIRDHLESKFQAVSNVIPFKLREAAPFDESELDLVTAVDVAIRDIRDIARTCHATARDQAEACLMMLEKALNAARE